MEEMNKIVEEFIKYIGLQKLNPEIIQTNHRPELVLLLKHNIEFNYNQISNPLESIKESLEPLMIDLLNSDALKSIIEPLQKENKELKTKILELNKYKLFYNMQYELNNGEEPK